MRILLTTHQFFPKHGSGTEVLARDTGLELMRRGHEVYVLTSDHSRRVQSGNIVHEDYEYRGLKVRALGLPKPARSMDNIRYEYDNVPVAHHVRRLVEDIAPDIVHMFHAERLSASIIDVFREANIPIVYTPTDFWAICVRNTLMKPNGTLSEGPDDISSNCLECRAIEKLLPETLLQRKSQDKKSFYREIAELALARREDEHPSMAVVRLMLARTGFLRERFNSVDAILAPTKLMHRMLTANGIDPGLVSLSPYGMNISQFRGAEPSRNGSGGLRFGYIGTIHPQKGVHVLIEAFKSLPRDANATLRLCGSLAHFPEYSREVYELARPDPRINFAGTFPNEKIAEELGKIDVLVVPSTWYENTPLVIYSAFAARVPVVATNLGGMAEVVHHGENGLLFEPGDATDLARQLGRLLQEPESLRRYSGNVGDVRTVEDSVDEMVQLYDDLSRKKRARAHERARDASKNTDDWLWLNHLGIDKNPELKRYAAPFPPEDLRRLPMGKADERGFAAYGVQAYRALLGASPVPWERLPVVLDYGCGSGPVARLFRVSGVDLYAADPDPENVTWIRSNLPRVRAVAVHRGDPLPYVDESFDAVYSVSAFTRGGRERHEARLADLARVTKPGAFLFLAVYGERAFERATMEAGVRTALGLDERLLGEAVERLEKDEPATVDAGGIAFVPGSHIRRIWTGWFDLVGIQEGAIQDLQDLVVLRRKAGEAHVEPAEKSADSKASRVSEHWARNVEARRSGEYAGNWLDHAAVQRLYINPMSTGSPDETWFPYVGKKYFSEPAGKALSLGCGGGALERHALSMGICSSFDAYDISEGSVEAAREEARKAGFLDRINYAAADLNSITLEENSYDAVFASMAIHHLENLEGVYQELTEALKPGGLLVFNEFVGPSQFQWTDAQLRLANELLGTIPERYRLTDQGTVLREIRRPTIEKMNETDPSESIRSAEIMPVTERFFEIVERRDYGGTLLHLVTAAGTIGNYDPDNEEDVALLRRMIEFEKRHIAAGEIGSDFTLVVARNRGA
jgi:glycosyltransferase involved in cell wall biosynthesis/SAM-dependent methyltransferase